MDENEFLDTESRVNDQPCAFSKALLRRCSGCSRAQKLFIAEREVVACLSPGAKQRCVELLELIRHNALFALHMTHSEEHLPHGKEIKVQCGGIQGLYLALHPEHGDTPAIKDIHSLIDEAIDHFDSLESLPYSEMVKSITHFQSRKRGR
jgi:hypothetical protein